VTFPPLPPSREPTGIDVVSVVVVSAVTSDVVVSAAASVVVVSAIVSAIVSIVESATVDCSTLVLITAVEFDENETELDLSVGL
jgi:hypothetical protein